jgi:hypothetical protein
MFGTHTKVGLKSTQIPTDFISTIKLEENLEKALGCGVDIENINEKHEKSDGSDKDNEPMHSSFRSDERAPSMRFLSSKDTLHTGR